MHPYSRGYEPSNPFGYQKTSNPSPPQNHQPTNRGPLIYSSVPDLAGIASFIGNCVYMNFPYDELSILVVNISQPDFVPEIQPQDELSKRAKKRSHKKRMRRKD
ncbi:hypothetical protein Hanom_Chr17g01577041 [Helianthus anomalus]